MFPSTCYIFFCFYFYLQEIDFCFCLYRDAVFALSLLSLTISLSLSIYLCLSIYPTLSLSLSLPTSLSISLSFSHSLSHVHTYTHRILLGDKHSETIVSLYNMSELYISMGSESTFAAAIYCFIPRLFLSFFIFHSSFYFLLYPFSFFLFFPLFLFQVTKQLRRNCRKK